MSALDMAKRRLFEDGLGVTNIKFFPGTKLGVTPEQMAEEFNKAMSQLANQDYEEVDGKADDAHP